MDSYKVRATEVSALLNDSLPLRKPARSGMTHVQFRSLQRSLKSYQYTPILLLPDLHSSMRPQFILSLALFFAFLCSGSCLVAEDLPPRTALDDYMEKPDESYKWRIVKTTPSPEMELIVIDMISQTWRTSEEVNRPQWQHWLTMAIPAKPKSNIGLLWIGGGANGKDAPNGPSERILGIAKATRTVVAELHMVPNQPLIFHRDGVPRTEDDLVAYTWVQFLKTGDATWPARNAMVKSAIRAMDTMTAVTSTDKSELTVDRFVVAGASKRGWTTWLTGALDKRVVGIAPIVIDVLDTKANIKNHFSSYGFWAPSVGDYVEQRIVDQMDHPRMQALLELVDPWYYRHRLTMPKFMLNAAGDQFFPADSSKFYFDDLEGQKHLRYLPNTNHSLGGTDAVESLIAWYSQILEGKPAPEFTWTTSEDKIVVKTEEKPDEVRLWQATNPDARDFRLESLGPKYTSTILKDQGNRTYTASIVSPKQGWTASFVELTFRADEQFPLKFTTGVQITPDVLPFKDKNPNLPPTITLRCIAPNQEVAKAIENAISSKKIATVATEMQFSQSDRATQSPQIAVQLNWKSVGPFDKSASAITGWLSEQKCANFSYRLESGNTPEHLK